MPVQEDIGFHIFRNDFAAIVEYIMFVLGVKRFVLTTYAVVFFSGDAGEEAWNYYMAQKAPEMWNHAGTPES